METSKDEFVRGGGGSPPYAGFVSNVLPAVQTSPEEENLPTGVSTNNGQLKQCNTNIDLFWYVIRCTYGREKKAYDYLLQKGIDAFYPTITRKKEVNGEKQLIEESRLPNLFFAHSNYETLKEFIYDNVHEETKYLRFYYNQHHDGTKEPLIVPDSQIKSLMLICESNAEDLILEPFTVEKFIKGQRVRVIKGPFSGVEGIVARFMGQQRVGISIEGLFTMATAYIPSSFLENIE